MLHFMFYEKKPWIYTKKFLLMNIHPAGKTAFEKSRFYKAMKGDRIEINNKCDLKEL
jgi:hypothetical protein